MIVEPGRVVAVEQDGVWVETANQSACGRCAARKGCGQSLLAQLDGHRSYIKAAFNGFAVPEFHEGQVLSIGIDEAAILRGSLLVYCVPIAGLLIGAVVGHIFTLPEYGVAFTAFAGLLMGGGGARWLSRRHADDERYQPVVVALAAPSSVGDDLIATDIARVDPQR